MPDAESEALLPAAHDRKKHRPDLPTELRASRVKRGQRDPTDDEVTHHEPLHLPFRNWCPICIAARGTEDPHWRRGDARRSDPQVQLDFLILTGNKNSGEQATTSVLVLLGRVSGGVSCTLTNKDVLEHMSQFVCASLDWQGHNQSHQAVGAIVTRCIVKPSGRIPFGDTSALR